MNENKDTPVASVTPEPWMAAKETQAVMEALLAIGAEARFVGGCVRDTLVQRPVKDIDVATTAQPDDVIKALEDANLKAIPTGIEHGTITAVARHRPFEITTLRRDVETHGRHATVAYTEDWKEDAQRRDFTMNALSLTLDGKLYDYFDGLEDLKAGQVRFVGDAAERVQEDYLRILRFFRFYGHYGKGAPDTEALKACHDYAHLIPELSGERVREELFKILLAPDAGAVFSLMDEDKVLKHVLPENGSIDRLSALCRVEAELNEDKEDNEDIAANPIRRLGAYLDPDVDAAASVADRLRFSNKQKKELSIIAAHADDIRDATGEKTLRVLLYRLGRIAVTDLMLIAKADGHVAANHSERTEAHFKEMLKTARAWEEITLPVEGKDALAMGVEPGPGVGKLLRAVETWWIEQDFKPDRDACLEKLEALAGKTS